MAMERRKKRRKFDFFVPLLIVIIGYFAFVLVGQQVHTDNKDTNEYLIRRL